MAKASYSVYGTHSRSTSTTRHRYATWEAETWEAGGCHKLEMAPRSLEPIIARHTNTTNAAGDGGGGGGGNRLSASELAPVVDLSDQRAMVSSGPVATWEQPAGVSAAVMRPHTAQEGGMAAMRGSPAHYGRGGGGVAEHSSSKRPATAPTTDESRS